MIDARASRPVALMALLLSLLAVVASLVGLLDGSLYGDLQAAGTIPKLLVLGSIAQDLVSLPLGMGLAVASVLHLRRPEPKRFIVLLGLVGYFFYGYGLYAIQAQYTSLYLLYLAIFGLAIYSMVFGLLSFQPELVRQSRLPHWVRLAIGGFLLLILIVLVPVWLIRSAPDIAAHVPGDVYGVFVLDLCIVFPALAITAYYLLRRVAFGNVLAGVALVKVFTLCLSVALGEVLKPFHGYAADPGMIGIFSGLTLIGGLLGGCYLLRLGTIPQAHPLSQAAIER